MRTNFYASENLRRLYEQRVGDSMTQGQFAKRYKIGGQTMLSQILSGAKPLPIDTAQKLARALRCTIYDICPEMADYISDELVPALGKGWRRAAALLLFLFIPLLSVPLDAKAAFTIKSLGEVSLRQVIELSTHCRRFRRWLAGCFAMFHAASRIPYPA